MDAFPGRHKLSGDCPVIILKDGKPFAALGSPGGHTITQNVPQIIFNLIDFEMSMQAAIDAPKIAFVEPNSIRVDNEIFKSTTDSLVNRGHQIKRGSIGNATGIRDDEFNEGEGAPVGRDIAIVSDQRGRTGLHPGIERAGDNLDGRVQRLGDRFNGGSVESGSGSKLSGLSSKNKSL